VRRFRRRTYEILELAQPGDKASATFDVFIITLILLNVIAVIVESLPEIKASETASFCFMLFECFSVAVFTVEYVLRVWSAVEDTRFSGQMWGRARFALTPLALIDFLAVVPSYLPSMFMGADLRAFRILRTFRVLRVLKLTRYSESLRLLGRVVRRTAPDLGLVGVAAFTVLILVSCLIYFFEGLESIPTAIWWSIVTMTSPGFDSTPPITTSGKVLASCVAVLGVALYALPTAIIGTGFFQELGARKRKFQICPHCGKPLAQEQAAAIQNLQQ